MLIMKRYFAYGSNMSISRLRRRVSSASKIDTARLKDYKFICNKIGGDGTAKANIEFAHGEEVWGVIFELTKKDLEILDSYEGGYIRKKLRVRSGANEMKVYSYISNRVEEDLRVAPRYKDYIIQGAQENELPKAYIEKLKRETGFIEKTIT